jgi:predicted metal-dependent hydrolase
VYFLKLGVGQNLVLWYQWTVFETDFCDNGKSLRLWKNWHLVRVGALAQSWRLAFLKKRPIYFSVPFGT